MDFIKRIILVIIIMTLMISSVAHADYNGSTFITLDLDQMEALTMMSMLATDFGCGYIKDYVWHGQYYDNEDAQTGLLFIKNVATTYGEYIDFMDISKTDLELTSNFTAKAFFEDCLIDNDGHNILKLSNFQYNTFVNFLTHMGYSEFGFYESISKNVTTDLFLNIPDGQDILISPMIDAVDPYIWNPPEINNTASDFENLGYISFSTNRYEHSKGTTKVIDIFENSVNLLSIYLTRPTYNTNPAYFRLYINDSKYYDTLFSLQYPHLGNEMINLYYGFVYRGDEIYLHMIVFEDTASDTTFDNKYYNISEFISLDNLNSDYVTFNIDYSVNLGSSLSGLLGDYVEDFAYSSVVTNQSSAVNKLIGVLTGTLQLPDDISDIIIVDENGNMPGVIGGINIDDMTIGQVAQTRFPFCLPYDLVRIVESFGSDSYQKEELTIIDLSFDWTYFSTTINVPIIIDLDDYGFSKIAIVTRYLSVVGAVLGMIYATKNFLLS